MGETRADLKLTNLFQKSTLQIRALVDTAANHLVITPEVAKTLGYDIEECVTKYVDIADGRRVKAPYIEGLRIEFENRCSMDAAVLPGNECLLGYLPLEAMDLIVDPKQQILIGRHTDGWYTRLGSQLGRIEPSD